MADVRVQETTNEAPVADQNNADAQVADVQPANADTTITANSVQELPDWAQKLIKDTRNEAAKYRNTIKEQETAAEQAERERLEEQNQYKELYEKAQADLQQAQTEATNERLSRLRHQIGSEAGLPQPLIDRLQGDDEESIRADAESLKAAIPQSQIPTATDGGAGLNGSPVRTQITDSQIRELSTLYGVSVESLKQQMEGTI